MSKTPRRRSRKAARPASRSASRKAGNSRFKKRKQSSTGRRGTAGRWRFRLSRLALGLIAAAVVSSILVAWHLDRLITATFEGRRWDVPAHVYAQPLELYEGRALAPGDVDRLLRQLGYRRQSRPDAPGTYARSQSAIALRTRPFRFWDGLEHSQDLFVEFRDNRISRLTNGARTQAIPIARLDPLLIGSLYPGVVEDRLITGPEAIPDLLVEALLAVEDQRFFEHHGLDFRGIARAAWVNLRSGEVRQGGSTLTQQLVKSYFLSAERSFRRKALEALMALLLERRYDKRALLTAYVNEVYLGQDGPRAIHGFGLASRFHFGRPLDELEPRHIALLAGMVRGPSYYDPRRYPDRARARRDLVLTRLTDRGALSQDALARAISADLGLAAKPARGASYFPAFMALVRAQLRRDYDQEDLASNGLQVFSTLDPIAQARAEAALTERLETLTSQSGPGLEGALIATSVAGGEIRAAVGGRDPGFDGFNRVLEAKRPIGSLIKPVVYLAALRSGRFHLASMVDDAPVSITLDDGKVWNPQNFDGTFEGPMPLVRALADSRNLPAVRVGMETGVAAVVQMLARLGFAGDVRPYPSVLLGAVSMSPLEVAQVYNTLAGGGAFTPLTAVRFVLNESGEKLGRYRLTVSQVVEPDLVAQIDAGLINVMRVGTGRGARARLRGDLEVAGKTGSSDDLRDSWFAGFGNDLLAVVWVGHDDNRPAGLTGAAGAMAVWADFFSGLPVGSLQLSVTDKLQTRWIHYSSGLASRPDCSDTVPVLLPQSVTLPPRPGCEPDDGRNLRERAIDWLKDVIG